MQGAWPVFGFFALIVVLAIVVGEGNTVFDVTGGTPATSTSTPYQHTSSAGMNAPPRETVSTPPRNTPSPEVLSPQEVEDRVARIYRELDALEKKVRETRLREPVSPYRGLVRLSQGSVYETDPDREYLMLRAESGNTTGIPVSKWYLRSYVTDKAGYLPKGDRTLVKYRSSLETDIVLLPGESAYLVTGESPLDTSFRENLCTGYLNDVETFYPGLGERCPYPKKELEDYGKIALDNDKCYDFVERLQSCTEPDDSTYSRATIGNACIAFIENTFNYEDCVRLHRYEPYFSRDGYWRIYLGERRELWRSKREIIQLLDENDRVIDVLEY